MFLQQVFTFIQLTDSNENWSRGRGQWRYSRVIQQVWLHQLCKGRGGWGHGWSAARVRPSVPIQEVLEADVGLGAIIHTVCYSHEPSCASTCTQSPPVTLTVHLKKQRIMRLPIFVLGQVRCSSAFELQTVKRMPLYVHLKNNALIGCLIWYFWKCWSSTIERMKWRKRETGIRKMREGR